MKNEDLMDWYMLFHTKSCCDCFQLKESHIYKGVGKMEVWEIIEFVRKQKGISVAELCGKEVSRSVYERFVKNQADTTVSKFSYFLQKLNLGYDELRIFDYPPEVANMDRMMKEMVLAFMNQDKEELQHLISLCEEKGDITQKERHLASLCKLLIARIVDEPIDVADSEVYQYLIYAQTWTNYELVLFNHCMYAFDPFFIDLVLDKALVSISAYQNSKDRKNESFRMLANAIIHFIQQQQRGLIWKYISKLEAVFLEEDMFFERNQYSLLTGIWEMIKGNEKGRQKVNQALQICQQLGATKYHKMNHELLRNVERIYEIDFRLDELLVVDK